MHARRRDLLRSQLLERARTDPRVASAALTGSAAAGVEDRWSDVDLFFGVIDVEPVEVLRDFSDYLYADQDAVHHFDLLAGTAVYRAFLLDGLLEVDLGLTSIEEFRSHGGAPFRVVFGDAPPLSPAVGIDVDHLAGLVWHHVLHARSSIERGRTWQAEYWISAVRDQVLTLAAHRHSEPTVYAKGADALPASLTGPLQETLVRTLDRDELDRALQHVVDAAVRELKLHDASLAHRLAPPLQEAVERESQQEDRL